MRGFSAFIVWLVGVVLIGGLAGGWGQMAYAQGSGNALSLDGNGDYMVVNYSGSILSHELLQRSDLTFMAWVYIETAVDGAEIVAMGASGESSAANYYYNLQLDTDNGNDLYYLHEYNSGANFEFTFDTNLETQRWYHIALVRRGNDDNNYDLELYINGNKHADDTEIVDHLRPNGGASAVFYLGTSHASDGSTWHGRIDDASVWEFGLGREEIVSLMYQNLAGTEYLMHGHWGFNEASGSTAYDATGDYDGTLVGNATRVASNAYTQVTPNAFPGEAYAFNGTSTWVNLQKHILPEDFTFELWVNPTTTNDGQVFLSATDVDASFNVITFLDWGYDDGGVKVCVRTACHTDGTKTTGWQHLALVVEQDFGASTTQVTVYRDGTMLWTQSLSNILRNYHPVIFELSNSTLGRWYLGARRTTDPDYFSGEMDEMRMWRTARTAEEVRSFRNHAPAPTTPGLSAHWQFNTANSIDGVGLTRLPNHSAPTPIVGTVSSEITLVEGTTAFATVASGAAAFPNTDAALTINTNTGTAPISVTKATSISNTLPTGASQLFDNHYWIMDRYGSGAFSADVALTVGGTLSAGDVADPNRLKLYTRGIASTGAWTQLASGASVSGNAVTFSGITTVGQFIVGRVFNTTPSTVAGTALDFDGTNDYAELPSFSPGNTFTFEFWINPEEAGRNQIFLGKHTASGGNVLLFGFFDDGLHLRLRNETFTVDEHVTGWQHLALVVEETGTDQSRVRIYRNGDLIGERVLATVLGDVLDGRGWVVGQDWDGNNTSDFFNGQFDEMRLWTTARTPFDMLQTRYVPLIGNEEGLLGYWQFNEGSGSVMFDVKSGQDGELKNGLGTANDWVTSPIPFGQATVATAMEQPGQVALGATGATLNVFNAGSANLVAARFAFAPNTLPSGVTTVFDDQYWVLGREGSGLFSADLTLTVPDADFAAADEAVPSQIRLYSRNAGSSGAWTQVATAKAVNVTAKTATFGPLQSLGQFIVARGEVLAAGSVTATDGTFENGVEVHWSELPADAALLRMKRTATGLTFDAPASGSPSDAVTINSFGLYSGQDITVEFWLNPTSINDQTFLHRLNADGSNRLRLGVKDGGMHVHLGNQSHTAGTALAGWQRLAFVVEQTSATTSQVTVYRNGGMLWQEHMNEVFVNDQTPGSPWRIGDNYLIYGSDDFYGDLKEMRVWSAARTGAQVRERLRQRLVGNESGLNNWYTFEETTGNVLDRVADAPSTGSSNGRVFEATRPTPVFQTVLASSEVQYADRTGLPGHTYRYCLEITDNAGNSINEVCDTGYRSLHAPADMDASDQTFIDHVTLFWSNRSTVNDGFRIYREQHNTANTWTLLGTTDASTLLYRDSSAVAGTLYSYCVTAYEAVDGDIFESDLMCDFGSKGSILPPADVAATDGEYADRVVINWTDQSDNEANFIVYRGNTAADATALTTLNANTSTYTDNTAASGTTYTYCVASQMTTPFSATSEKVCDTGGRGTLAAPTDVAATDATFDDRIAITWTDAATTEDAFVIYRDANTATNPPLTEATVIDTTVANVTSYVDIATSTLTAGATYRYCVVAVSTDSGSDVTSAAVCDTGQRIAVLAPTDVIASDNTAEDRIEITWQNAATQAVLFKVYRNGTVVKTTPVGQPSFTDTQVASGDTLTYCVAAVTAQGAESTYGTNVGTTCDTGSRQLAPAGGVTATDDEEEDEVNITWVDNSEVEIGYHVYRQFETDYALAFDGSDDVVESKVLSELNGSSTYTLEGWFKSEQAANSWIAIMSQGNWDTSDNWVLMIRRETTGAGAFHFYIDNTGAGRHDLPFTMSSWGSWHHFAIVSDGSALKAYLNGELVGTKNGAFPLPTANNEILRIGRNARSNDPYIMDGTLDELRIWNVARTQSEIQEHLYRNLSGHEPGLVRYFPFYEGEGSRARELAQGQHGTLQNMTVMGSTSVWQTDTAPLTSGGRIATTGASQVSYTDRQGVPGVIHRYTVAPFDSYGAGEGVSETGRRVLLAPTNFSASDGTAETSVTLTWEDNSLVESGYLIYRDGVVVDTADVRASSYTDTNVSIGHSYAYAVTAYDGYGESEAVSDAGSTTLLAAASVSASSVYTDRVEVVWVDISDNNNGYTVFRDGTALTTSLSADASSYTDTSAPTTPAAYCVQATTSTGGTSAQVCATGQRVDTAPPISNLNTTVGLLTKAVPRDGDQQDAKIGTYQDQHGIFRDLVRVPVAVSGDYAIMGYGGENSNDAGAAYILKRNPSTGTWEETTKLIGEDYNLTNSSTSDDVTLNPANDRFGSAVAIYDRWALVGAPNADPDGVTASVGITPIGAAFLYKRTNEEWTLVEGFPGDPSSDDGPGLGTSVAVSQNWIVMGIPGRCSSGGTNDCNKGALTFYERVDDDDWAFRTLLEGGHFFNATQVLDKLGLSVAIHEDVVIGGGEGRVSWYTYAPSTHSPWGVFPHRTYVTNLSGAVDVAIDDTWSVVGDPDGTQVVIFSKKGAETADHLTQPTPLQTITETGIAGFGKSVSLDGDRLLIGADQAAYLYRLSDTNVWEREEVITSGSTTDAFGDDVAISGVHAIISAPKDATNGVNSGAVYLRGEVTDVAASDGSFPTRVQVKWTDHASNEAGFRILRDDVQIAEISANLESYNDFDAPPGRLSTYCVVAFSHDDDESAPVCDQGVRPPNGTITGRVATNDGAGTENVEVCPVPVGGMNPNRGLLFDGSGGYVRIPSNTDLDLGATFTVEAWVRRSADFTNAADIISRWGAGGARNAAYALMYSETGTVNFSTYDGSSRSDVVGGDLPADTWTHVAATLSGGNLTLYINGDFVTSLSSAVTPQASDFDLAFGHESGTGNRHFGGLLDEVRIWSVAKTSAEIKATMNQVLLGHEAGLVGLWGIHQGEGNAVADLTTNGNHGSLEGGTYWSDQGAPFNFCTTTDVEGNYTLANLRYGTETTFELSPTLNSRTFTPARRTITLGIDTPVQNQVDFTDASAFSVTGRITFADAATCPVEGIELLVDGDPLATSAADGSYALSLLPRAEAYTIVPSLDGRTLTPASTELSISDDVADLNFSDGTTRSLGIFAGGGCNTEIGDVRIRVRTPDGCFENEYTVQGTTSLNLPPQSYEVEVVGVTLPASSTLDYADVLTYFNDFGPQSVDLSEADTTLSFTYRAPLSIQIAGLPGTTENACSASDKLGVPILAENQIYPIAISVFEDYGTGQLCPATDPQITISDAISDLSGTPTDTTLVDTHTMAYPIFAGAANVLTGIIIDGVDRSHQKSLFVSATADGRTTDVTEWALVEGQRVRPGTIITATSSEVPLMILRDPPGDRSYSYLEEGESYCYSMHEWMSSNTLEFTTFNRGQLGDRTSVGVGVSKELEIGTSLGLQTKRQLTWNRGGHNTICLEINERFSTSDDPRFVGESADVFIGAGLNFKFAQTDALSVTDVCEIDLATDLTGGIDDEKPFETAYAYTTHHIENILIPQLEALRDDADTAPATRAKYETTIDNWEEHLTYNRDQKAKTLDVVENRTFSAGADFESVVTRDSTYYHEWGIRLFSDRQGQLHNIFDAAGKELESKKTLRFSRETLVTGPSQETANAITKLLSIPAFRVPDLNGNQTQKTTRSWGYVLSDANQGDTYSVDVMHPEGKTVSIVVPEGGDILPGGQLTRGAASGIGGAGLAKAFGTTFQRASFAVGGLLSLASGAYDLARILDPYGTSAGDVQIRKKQTMPIGSPVFRVVGGATSCPAEIGTRRRDVPVISIDRVEANNVDPSGPAVFRLFLGNDSETNERRRYYLRLLNESNPYGAIISVNGTWINDGIVFEIEPGQTVEAALEVLRGPSRFEYEDMGVMLYPECADLLPSYREAEAVIQRFTARFEATCSDISIFHDTSHELDFNAASTNPGIEVILNDFDLSTFDPRDLSTTDDDIQVTNIGIQYRKVGANDWTNGFTVSRDNVITASGQTDPSAATSYTRTWTGPPSAEDDGDYEFRAFTQCTGNQFVYSDVSTGFVDRTAPSVFGKPQPADQTLELGDVISVTFDEAVQCSAINDANTLGNDNVTLHYVNTNGSLGDAIATTVACDSRTLILTPSVSAPTLEGRTLRAQVSTDLIDAIGNPLANTVSWDFTVRQSAFAWNPQTLDAQLPFGQSATLIADLHNGKAQSLDFTLDNTVTLTRVEDADGNTVSSPSVNIAPSLTSGTLDPSGSKRVSFSLPNTLALGRFRGTLNASSTTEGSAPLYLDVQVGCFAPQWSVTPSDFEYTMTLTGQLAIDGVTSTDTQDVIAAIVDGEVRGTTNVEQVTLGNNTYNLVSLIIYSNEPFGEQVTFQVYDASACQLHTETSKTYTFQADVSYGQPAQPISIQAPPPPSTDIALAAGWTWISVNKTPTTNTAANRHPNAVLRDEGLVEGSPGDVIKNQTQFSLFDHGSQEWIGSLTELQPGQAYQVKLGQNSRLRLSGNDAALTGQIALQQGWNWIGYLPQVALFINDALANVTGQTGDLIKSQVAFAQYVEGAGWIGSLKQLDPGYGYLMRMQEANPGALDYPDPANIANKPAARMLAMTAPHLAQQRDMQEEAHPQQANALSTEETKSGKQIASACTVEADEPTETERQLGPGWIFDPVAYQHTMNIVATLEADGFPLISEGSVVAAWVGDEVRGLARVTHVEALGVHQAFLTVYSNGGHTETVHFTLYDSETNVQHEADATLMFEKDAIQGSVSNPVLLSPNRQAITTAEALPTTFALAENYPNPFNPQTTIQYALPEASDVTIVVYDMLGRMVSKLVDQAHEAGRYTVTFNADDLASGTYIYRMQAGTFQQVRRMVLVK